MCLKHKRQSKRYAKITLTRQFLRQGIFRIPSSKKQRQVIIDLIKGVGITKFHVSVVFFLLKTKMAIKEIFRNYPETAVFEGSGLQDPFCRKSRKSIYKYYLGDVVCQISGLFYCFSFDENRYDNQGDMQKLHTLSLKTFFCFRLIGLVVKRKSRRYIISAYLFDCLFVFKKR